MIARNVASRFVCEGGSTTKAFGREILLVYGESRAASC